MRITPWITAARAAQASDLHLEAGLPACLRVRGQLRNVGEPLAAAQLEEMAHELVGDERWPEFLERRSCDLARTLSGARCRINVLCTSRGVGLAIRFLAAFEATLERLNLHPAIARFAQATHGLVLVSGATGSGKSSTLAALLQDINAREKRHILTLEAPIEYVLTPRQSLIRQREVGRDTPSFEQGLYDAMREDPDVLMVGELRDPETMRLTLNAAETGHLVLATVHSASAAEALQRVVSAFPAEIQAGICAQLADCLVGVVCQRLRYLAERGVRAPECEILVATQSARAVVRQGQFSKLQTTLETGGNEGSFTFQRYRDWMDKKTDWVLPSMVPVAEATLPGPDEPAPRALRTARGAAGRSGVGRARGEGRKGGTQGQEERAEVLEIQHGDEDLEAILSKLEEE